VTTIKITYKINDISLSADNYGISYMLLNGAVTGRCTIPLGEFTKERMIQEVEADITKRKDHIEAAQKIIAEWKGYEGEFDLEK